MYNMMSFNPNMKPARRRRSAYYDHWRRWRRKTDFNLLYPNGNRLAGDNYAAGHNNSKKTNDT
jgi:hypothetical protein